MIYPSHLLRRCRLTLQLTAHNQHGSVKRASGNNPISKAGKQRPSSSLRKPISTSSAHGRGSTTGHGNSYGSGGAAIKEGTRINKCLPSLSRRSADEAIASGRVTINGRVAKTGDRVFSGDVVRFDDQLQKWESFAAAKQQRPSRKVEERDFVYLKYWKPPGVTCTSDSNDKTNIINAGKFHLFPQRLFTIGRLDKASTGLILLTSDGRVNNAILSPKMSKEKVSLESDMYLPVNYLMEHCLV
jgi:ribosomal 50S subunit-recycling heat shock protein